MTIKSCFNRLFWIIELIIVSGVIFFSIILIFNISSIIDKINNKYLLPRYINTLKSEHNSLINLIQYEHLKFNDNMKDELKGEVDYAYSIAYTIFENNLNKSVNKNLLINELKNILKNLNSHYFILDTNGNILLKSEFDISETLKKKITKKSLLSFNGLIINKNKFIYFRLFEPFNLIIGTFRDYNSYLKNFKTNLIDELKIIISLRNLNFLIFENKKMIYYNSIFHNISPDKLTPGISKQNNFIFYVSFLPELNWKIISIINEKKFLINFKLFQKEFFYNRLNLILLFIISLLMLGVFLIYNKVEKSFSAELNILKKHLSLNGNIDRDLFQIKEFQELADIYRKYYNKINELRNYIELITKNINAGVAIINKNIKIEDCNSQFEKMLNFKFNQNKDYYLCDNFYLKGCNFTCKKGENNCVILKNVNEGKRYNSDNETIILKNGKEISVQLNLTPITKNKFLFLIIDITQERKLFLQLEKLKKAINQAPVSIVITDTSATIEYVNPHFSKVTGYSEQEAIGNNPKILQTNYNKRLYKDLWETIKSGKVWEGEFLNRKKDGSLYWEKAIIGPVFDNNSITNFVAVKLDITELKKLQNELEKSKKKAEEANKLKSEFLAIMSHEIRTPMNAILGFIELLYETELSDTQKEYIKIIKNSSENLLTILNDILDFSKIEAGKMEFEDTEFNLYTLINNIINIFSKKAAEKNISLSCEIDENVPEYYRGDPTRIGQIINNLMSNAIKFTEKGEVRIEVKLNSLKGDKAELLFKVKDTGKGISKENIKKIFEKFSQEDSSITRKFGGTGLGLGIAKKIVEHYNGNIWVESEVGKGSIFYFTLKLLIAEKLQEKNVNNQVEELNFEGAKILVVEDNITNQILIQEILKKFKLKVDVASNGIEALKKLTENSYDLIFLDWYMPEMNGHDTLKILKCLEKGLNVEDTRIDKKIINKLKNKKFNIVVLTAAVLDKEISMMKKAGANDFLSKPIDINRLKIILKKFLSDNYTKNKESTKKQLLKISNLLEELELDKEILDNLLSTYKKTFEDTLENIKTAISENNYEKINFEAHKLKGASYNLRLNKIGEIAKKIEEHAKKREINEIKILYEKLKGIKIE